jgi:ribulose-5-phosphate 4-epimerase/fuculose-1-phosphate aldolase
MKTTYYLAIRNHGIIIAEDEVALTLLIMDLLELGAEMALAYVEDK